MMQPTARLWASWQALNDQAQAYLHELEAEMASVQLEKHHLEQEREAARLKSDQHFSVIERSVLRTSNRDK